MTLHALMICALVLVGAVVVAVVVGGCILSGCLELDDTQPDEWTRDVEDDQ